MAKPRIPSHPEAITAAVVREGKGGMLEFLLLQRKPSGKFPFKWQLPGGKKESGETEAMVLRREMLEEARLLPRELEHVHLFERITDDGANFTRNTYIIHVPPKTEPTLSSEHINHAWVTFGNVGKYDLLPGTEEALRATQERISSHRKFMDIALEEARKSISAGKVHSFYTGSVIVPASGKSIYTGYKGETHRAIHAEEVAIEAAGNAANGATLYTLLEPCTSRDPNSNRLPCADLIKQAGIRKVVVAVLDKNPRIKGTGIDQLRKHGVEVVLFPNYSRHAKAAEKLNRNFFAAKRAQS